jgi:hypothetical protein
MNIAGGVMSESGHTSLPTGVAEAREPEAAGPRQVRLMWALGASALSLIVGVAIGLQITKTGEANDEASAAGRPFSAEVQRALEVSANIKGWSLDGDSGTGRCEQLKQVVEHMPVSQPTTLTRANVEAASEPNGSLFLTISNYTSGNEEALSSIAPCVEYLIGTRVGEN